MPPEPQMLEAALEVSVTFGVGQHAGRFEPGSHVGVDGDGVNGVGALTQQVLRSSDGGR